MRRIIRRTATIVTVQTWTVTWAEEDSVAEPPPAEAGLALPPGPQTEAEATRRSSPAMRSQVDTPLAPAGDAPGVAGVD